MATFISELGRSLTDHELAIWEGRSGLPAALEARYQARWRGQVVEKKPKAGGAKKAKKSGCKTCGEKKRVASVKRAAGKPAPAAAISLPCIHLGATTGQAVKCLEGCTARLKTFACSVYGTCTIEKRGEGAPGRCRGCESYAAFPPVQTRHLLYHIYPVHGNGAWQWNVQQILRRINLFNGKRVVGIVTDGITDPPDDVKRSFGDTVSEFIVLPNNRKLREGVTLEALYERVATDDPTAATFYGHAKGVTSRAANEDAIAWWAEAMYDVCLDYHHVADALLQRFPVVGPFKRTIKGWDESASQWHYSGSFHWFRNAPLFAQPDWRRFDKFIGAIEAYPSLHFAKEQAGCLFYEFQKHGHNWLYSRENWVADIQPQLDAWKRANVRAPERPADPARRVVDDFHRLYYDLASKGGTWQNTFWRGAKVEKCPMDLHTYQEIIHEVRPRLIVETGTRHGGSALFFADMLRVCDVGGSVVSIDVDPSARRPSDSRVNYITGDSVDKKIIQRLETLAKSSGPVMVVLDSDHSESHVYAELNAYAPLVSVGSYLVVEDTNVNGHPVLLEHGPGPAEAVEAFLRTELGRCFERDRSREKLLLTFFPGGWLKRLR